MPRIALAVTTVVLVALTPLVAQKKPNFSGRWVQISPEDGAGGEQLIQHTESTLTMSHDSEGDGHKLIYNLDGSESKMTMQSHGMDIVTIAKAVWNGDRLTITSATTYGSPDRKLDQTMVWSINEKGQLVIDLTQTSTGRPTEKLQVVHQKR
jgi:hypothetical protein